MSNRRRSDGLCYLGTPIRGNYDAVLIQINCFPYTIVSIPVSRLLKGHTRYGHINVHLCKHEPLVITWYANLFVLRKGDSHLTHPPLGNVAII